MGKKTSSVPSISSREVARVAAALRTAIRLSGVSNRQIERALGMSTGYITRILKGQVELRIAHVLSVCRIIGMPAGNFFTALFPPEGGADRRAGEEAESGQGPLHGGDLEASIQEIRGYIDELEDLLVKRKESV